MSASENNWQGHELLPQRRRIDPVHLPSSVVYSGTKWNPNFPSSSIAKYNFKDPVQVALDCNTYNENFKYQKGVGPGDLTEFPANIRSKSTWLTDPWQIYIFADLLPLLAGILVFTFFFMVALVLIYGLIRHCYLDRVLPSVFFTLKPLRKDKLKIIYIKYPDEVALNNLAFYKWNPIRVCYRRHSICQLHHNHRNHRKLSDHHKINNNDGLTTLKAIKEESEHQIPNLRLQLKPVIAVAKFKTKRKKQVEEESEIPKQINETPPQQSKHVVMVEPLNSEIKREDVSKQGSIFFRRQQQFPDAENMMSVNDLKISSEFLRAQQRKQKRRRKSMVRFALPFLTKKDLGKTENKNESEPEPEETKAEPVPKPNKKRKSSTPDPNPILMKIQTPAQDNPNEFAGKKLIRKRKPSVPTGKTNQGKIQMKVLRPELPNKNRTNNYQKDDSSKRNGKK